MLALVALVANFPLPEPYSSWTLWFGAAVGLLQVAFDSWSFRRDPSSIESPKPERWQPAKAKDQAEVRIKGAPFTVYTDEYLKQINHFDVKYDKQHRRWRLARDYPTALDRYVIHKDRIDAGSDLSNDTKVRLSSLPSGDKKLLVQKTKYLDGLVTNEFTGRQLKRGRHVTYDPWEIISDDSGNLLPLGECELSNHIGLSLIVKTCDNQFILQRASKKSNMKTDSLGATASGSLDWSDLRDEPGATHFIHALRRGMIREFREETRLALGSGWLGARDDIKFLGFGRLIPRGGLPEFVFGAHSEKPEKCWSSIGPKEPETKEFFIVSDLDGDTGTDWNNYSYSLQLAAHLWKQAEARKRNGPSLSGFC